MGRTDYLVCPVTFVRLHESANSNGNSETCRDQSISRMYKQKSDPGKVVANPTLKAARHLIGRLKLFTSCAEGKPSTF